jgi:hypothetical protein
MATGAVVGIQNAKVRNILRIYRDRISRRPTWRAAASRAHKHKESQRTEEASAEVHGRLSSG